MRNKLRLLTASAAMAFGGAATALAKAGQPVDWGLGLQEAVTPIAAEIDWFHDMLLWIITAITVFVLALLLYVIFKFSEKSNPTPSKTTHNTAIEAAWTIIPVLILGFISIFSFRVLYNQYDFPKADVVVKAIANQWYWDYEYPDAGVSFASNMVTDEDVVKAELVKTLGDEDKAEKAFNDKFGDAEGLDRNAKLRAAAQDLWKKNDMVRLMSTDTDVVVPVNKVVHVLITSNDVMHNWTIPAFGSKMDAVPGRTTATWFKATKTGTFYGQCSELCGIRHAFMPITVQVVSDDLYKKWVTARKADDEDQINSVRKAIREAHRRDRTKTFATLKK